MRIWLDSAKIVVRVTDLVIRLLNMLKSSTTVTVIRRFWKVPKNCKIAASDLKHQCNWTYYLITVRKWRVCIGIPLMCFVIRIHAFRSKIQDNIEYRIIISKRYRIGEPEEANESWPIKHAQITGFAYHTFLEVLNVERRHIYKCKNRRWCVRLNAWHHIRLRVKPSRPVGSLFGRYPLTSQ